MPPNGPDTAGLLSPALPKVIFGEGAVPFTVVGEENDGRLPGLLGKGSCGWDGPLL